MSISAYTSDLVLSSPWKGAWYSWAAVCGRRTSSGRWGQVQWCAGPRLEHATWGFSVDPRIPEYFSNAEKWISVMIIKTKMSWNAQLSSRVRFGSSLCPLPSVFSAATALSSPKTFWARNGKKTWRQLEAGSPHTVVFQQELQGVQNFYLKQDNIMKIHLSK